MIYDVDTDTVPILPAEFYMEKRRKHLYRLSVWSFWFGLSLVTTSAVAYGILQFIK